MKNIYFLFLFFLPFITFSQVINEVDADTSGSDMEEFVELKWTENTALDGYVVVFFNGSSDTSYAAFDLDGFSTDANGFFILGNTATSPDILFNDNGLQNGADAVVLYTGNDTDFPDGTAVTSTNMISAVVYDTNDGDDTGLLDTLFGVGMGVQYNEDENSSKDTESIQRQTDGTYVVKAITLRQENDAATCPLVLSNANATCDDTTAGTDTYTATIDFTGGDTSVYTVTSDVGTVSLTAGNPSTDATGTITITGIDEGVDVTITVTDGGLCNLNSTISAATCVPTTGLPIYEPFDYTVGEDLNNQSGWIGINSGASSVIGGAGGLTYSGLADSGQVGNHITFQGSGQESKLEFNEVATGTVYVSFIIQATDISMITDSDGGYFASIANSDSSYDLRLWIQPDTDPIANTYQLAVTTETSNPTNYFGSYTTNTSIFIVMSYSPGTGDYKGWVNPTALGGTEPAATFSGTDTDIENSLDRFLIRRDTDTETPAILLDELRIGTTWADVTPTTLSVSDNNFNNVSLSPNPNNTGMVMLRNLVSIDNVSVSVFDMLGKQVINQKLSDNTLNISGLKSGVYLVRISQDNGSITKKLVIN